MPVLLLDAFQDGAAEEIIVVRLRPHPAAAARLDELARLGAAARPARLVPPLPGLRRVRRQRGHGHVFGWWFQRTRRVWPLVIAHFLIDAVSFIGYIYLHGHVDWI